MLQLDEEYGFPRAERQTCPSRISELPKLKIQLSDNF